MVFTNGNVYTMDSVNTYYSSGYIREQDGLILEIGDMKDFKKKPGEVEKNLEGRIVIPGMITGHSHFYAQFARGISGLEPIETWQHTLTRLWWKLDRKLTMKQCYYSAMMGLIEGIKSGTTLFFDHQASPSCIDGVMDALAEAVRQTGARAALSYEVTDRNGKEGAIAGIRENERFIQKCMQNPSDQIRPMIGLHAIYSVEEDTLEACAQIGKDTDTGFHIHVAEGMADETESYRRYDENIIAHLKRSGILNPKSIAAHGVCISESEIDIFQTTGATLAYNGLSNANSGVGIAPVVSILEHGGHAVFGGDGFTSDMFHEISVDILLQRLKAGSPAVFTGNQIHQMLYDDNQCLTENVFGKQAGVLKTGSFADFLVIEYDSPTPLMETNIMAHLTSAFSGKIKMTVAGGKIVVQDGHCTLVDEQEVFAHCREEAAKLWKSI